MPPSIPSGLEGRQDLKLGLAAEMLRSHRPVHLTAWGTSMLPSVWPGDLLTIESVASHEVVPGDIVLVLRNQRPFIHRLVQQRSTENCISWITRGDAMPHDDPPIAASELLGRVTTIRRGQRSFIPSQKVSHFHWVSEWTRFRWQRFCSLMFRTKSAWPQEPEIRQEPLVRGALHVVGEMPGNPSSGASL